MAKAMVDLVKMMERDNLWALGEGTGCRWQVSQSVTCKHTNRYAFAAYAHSLLRMHLHKVLCT